MWRKIGRIYIYTHVCVCVCVYMCVCVCINSVAEARLRMYFISLKFYLVLLHWVSNFWKSGGGWGGWKSYSPNFLLCILCPISSVLGGEGSHLFIHSVHSAPRPMPRTYIRCSINICWKCLKSKKSQPMMTGFIPSWGIKRNLVLLE